MSERKAPDNKETGHKLENAELYNVTGLLEVKKTTLFIKRLFDVSVSTLSILILAAFFIIIAIIIKTNSAGPVFYKQTRVGKNGRLFKILKFRTMVVDADKKGRQITVGDDSRITSAGKFLRKAKIDELPQIINIIIGDMSFVGPRPEVPKYVEMYNETQRQVLLVRPGITDIASIEYRNESDVLAGSSDPERLYIEEIMPIKLNYNLQYIKSISLFTDIKLIISTVLKVLK